MKNEGAGRTVVCGDKSITYFLTRKKVKNVNLRIKPDGRVLVSANRGVPLKFIDEFVMSKQQFIFDVVARLAEKEQIDVDMLKSREIKLQCEKVFKEVLDEQYPKFEKYNVPYPEVSIRFMTSRWGSCQPLKGKITLNTHLILYSRKCIEYVVVHELSHFVYPNHSQEFWDFVAMMLPGWKECKAELNET